MKIKAILLSIAAAQGLYAMNVDRHNFYTRDYLDFGQNLGQFTAGATNITITKKNGQKVAFPDLPFPDFSKFDGSNRTSVGGAYTASSKHVAVQTGRNGKITREFKKSIHLGDTQYSEMQIKTYWGDSALTRTNKFIVEGGYKATDFRTIKSNPQDYFTNYQGEKSLIVYRSGNGRMSFDNWSASARNNKDSIAGPGVAGGLFYINPSDINGGQLKVVTNDNRYGPLKGAINTGDSGSPAFIFNNKTKEWELIGTGWGGTPVGNGQRVGNTFWGIVLPSQIDDFKKTFEVAREANGSYTFEENKDSVYSDGGEITMDMQVDQKGGGIILKGENKTLTIKGEGSFAGAGIDIAEGSSVLWGTRVEGALHKIGKGTLEVTKATNGNLRMGEGITRLSVENSFKEVHLANNEGTLIINADNATDYNKLSFGKNGATLDLNGYDATISGVKAYNANAIITNNNVDKLSTLTFNNASDTMIHANIKGNTNIQASAASGKKIIFDGGFDIQTLNGSNQHLVLQGKPVPHATWTGASCIGGLGFLFGGGSKTCTIGHFINQFDSAKANANNQNHMVVNKTVTFNQPDWLQREYKGNIALSNGSKLFIEKNADVSANIVLDNSTLAFNSKTLYIDNNDSKNLTQNIQSGTINADTIGTINYKGRLTAANNSSITSNGIKDFSASIDLNHSTLTAQNDTIKLLEEGLKLENNSTISAKSLHIKDITSTISVDENSSVNIEELKIEDSIVSLSTKNENLGTISIKASTINVADSSILPKNVKLVSSTLAFNNIHSTFSLNNSTFDEKSNLKANILNHKQGDTISWEESNSLRNLIIADTLNLTNVGSGQNNERFLALKLEKTKMAFEDKARVNVSFANTYEELFADKSILRGNLYDMIEVEELQSNGELLVNFVGQNSSSKIQAVATQAGNGVKISFTDVNQVNSDSIIDGIAGGILDAKSVAFRSLDDNQLSFLNDLIVSNPDHPLVLDVAFNKNNSTAISRIVERIQKIDNDAKEISKTITQSVNLQTMNNHNNVVSNRISTIKTSYNNISSYKYASLDSDMPLEYPMQQNANLLNNVWANAGGGYFDGDGNLKYFSTNMGYDRQYTFNESDVILGGLVSLGRSYASNSAYNDDTTNYGFGLYGVLTHNAHEVQLNGNYVTSRSKKYTDTLTANKVTNDSFGINSIYKYTFDLKNNHAIKPIVGLEYVANKMAGYTLGLMEVKNYDYRALSGILGAEYAYTNQNLFFSVGISGKKAIDRGNNKIQVGINGSNHFIGYDLQNDKTIYNLDMMADYKINHALTLGANINLQTTLRGESGIGGLFRVEYRF